MIPSFASARSSYCRSARLAAPLSSHGLTSVAIGNTAAHTKSPPPRTDASARLTPSASARRMAAICANTSGAPLPNANSVAPATSSGSPRYAAMFSSAGMKNPLATIDMTWKSTAAQANAANAEPAAPIAGATTQ